MDNNKIIHSVISLLAVDGKINRPEKQFCKATCIRLGVSQDVVKTVLDQIRQGKVSVQISKDAIKRKKIFHLLVRAAAADGEINSRERSVLDEIAARIKISRRDVKRLVASRLEEAQQAKIKYQILKVSKFTSYLARSSAPGHSKSWTKIRIKNTGI